MDEAWKSALKDEAAQLKLELGLDGIEKVSAHIDLLLKWNAKVNLTRITAPIEVRIKHVLDSLGALSLVPAGSTEVLDMGAGAGFPGITWMCARPELKVTLVDSVQKKVAFLKTALVQLKLSGRAVQARLEGHPKAEDLGSYQVVVSRAFMELSQVLPLALPYLSLGGCIIAMLGPRESPDQAEQIVGAAGYRLEERRELTLPQSMGRRQLLRAVPRGTT